MTDMIFNSSHSGDAMAMHLFNEVCKGNILTSGRPSPPPGLNS